MMKLRYYILLISLLLMGMACKAQIVPQVVNVGHPNQKDGDNLYQAGTKINAEFWKYSKDSAKWIHWADTLDKIATKTDIANFSADTNEYDPIYAADSAGLIHFTDTAAAGKIATKADVQNATITESDPIYAGDSADYIKFEDFTNRAVVIPIPVDATDAASKSYVDQQTSYSQVWQAPVEDIVSTLANGITINKRYILSTDSHIYTSDGDNTWTDEGTTTQGTTVNVNTDANVPANDICPYNFNGTSWVSMGTVSSHNSLANMDGGTAGEYYHETAAEHTVSTQSATAARNGFLTSTDWSTFNNKLATNGSAANLTNFPATSHNSTTGIQGGASNDYYHLTAAEHTVAAQAATASVNGYLSSTDWTTFNGKLSPTGSANSLTNFPTLNQNTTGSAASLLNSRNIYGNPFNGTQSLAQIIASTYGGTGNGFFKVSGPATTEKTFTFPNANATIARTDAAQTFLGNQTFDRIYFSAYNYLINGGTSSISLLSTYTGGIQMDLNLGNTNAGLNFGGLNGGIYWDVNKVTIRANSGDIIWGGTYLRTATDSFDTRGLRRTADNLKLNKADSSSTLGNKYATGKMLTDGLATKLSPADTNNLRIDVNAIKADLADNTDFETALAGSPTIAGISLGSRPGEFNILSYGAVSGDGLNDADNVRLAVAAATASHGTVIIPAGSWNITDSIILVQNVHIKADKGAEFTIAANYTGCVFYHSAPNGVTSVDAWVEGGRYVGTTRTWKGIKLISGDNTGIARFHFTDMYFENPRYGMYWQTIGTGYISANEITNMWLWLPVRGWVMRESATSNGMNNNIITNLQMQREAATVVGIDSLTGDRNSFIGLVFNDFNTTPTMWIGRTAESNSIDGKDENAFGFVNNGMGNHIVSNGNELPFERKMVNGVSNDVVWVDVGKPWGGAGKIDYTVVCEGVTGDTITVERGTIPFIGIVRANGTVVYNILHTDAAATYAETHASSTYTSYWDWYMSGTAHLLKLMLTPTSSIHTPKIRLYFTVTRGTNGMIHQY